MHRQRGWISSRQIASSHQLRSLWRGTRASTSELRQHRLQQAFPGLRDLQGEALHHFSLLLIVCWERESR